MTHLVSNDIYNYQPSEIIEKLKSITLLEATELVKEIEKTFGVDTYTLSQGAIVAPQAAIEQTASPEKTEEQTTFDVILKEVPGDDQKSKRLTVFRIIRELTSLGLKESKELTNSLPKPLKESISKQEAEEVKKQLEEAGAKAVIQ